MTVKRYAERDAMALDEAGSYYVRHVMAMTSEGLHSKGDIAAELGWRDMQIDALQQQVNALTEENEYIRNRFTEADIICGKLILAMRSAVIEAEHGEGMKSGMSWIFNTLHGPGDLPPEEEKDAQKYFDREVSPLNQKLDELIDWFVARNKRLQAATLRNGDQVGDHV